MADVINDLPQSRSREFAAFVRAQPHLKNAIVVADPDYLLESLPYYIDNATYFIREQRFGNVVTFTNKSLLRLDLDDVLKTARTLNQEHHEPVIILLTHQLDPDQPAEYSEGYNWTFAIEPGQVHRFLDETQRLGHFSPARSDESFDAYLFDHPK